MSIKVYNGIGEVPVKIWKFPGGEVGVRVEAEITSKWFPIICLKWEGNDDLIALAQLVDIFRGAGVEEMVLEMPYFPYARQDRQCWPGESFALKVVADYINSMKFSSVIVMDPHSAVLRGVVNNLCAIAQEDVAKNLPKYDYLIAPDAGAAAKIFFHEQVARGNTQVLIAEKKRDENGKIIAYSIEGVESLNGKTACVVDDICDGGATFIELGKSIWRGSCPVLIDLYVTHGIYSKGTRELEYYYDNLYVANLMNQSVKNQVKEI